MSPIQTVYLDSTFLVELLYGKQIASQGFEQCYRLAEAIRQNRVGAVVSFYALPELYAYVAQHQPESEVSPVFRLSLVELFQLPIGVMPYLDRTDLNHLRLRFNISDPDDARHVAAVLFKKCDAIITFDHHFDQVANVIPVYTPDEFLTTLKTSNA